MSLVACPECNRHIRNSEATCPFCRSEVGSRLAALAPRAMPKVRLGRAALFAFATAAAGATACAADSDEGKGNDGLRDAGDEQDGMSVAVYGAPSPSGGASNAGGRASSGGDDGSGGVAALYGAVPLPTGGSGSDAAPPEDDGGSAAIYGAAPEYGAPPPPQQR